MDKSEKKSFYLLVAKIAVPVILQNLITIGVNMMDTIMLGSYGELQLSGASLANEFINIFQILCMGMGGGAAVLTAQYWGANDKVSMKKTITIMLRFCFGISLLFTAVSLLWPAEIMRLFTPDEAIVAKGVLYFRISAFTYVIFGVTQTMTIILKSVRQMKIPLLVSIGAFFINIFFNWVFIFGNLGAPEMQIEGAALGTLIARLFEFVMISGYVLLRDKKIEYCIRDLFMPCIDHAAIYFRYSLPVMCSDGLLAVGNSVVAVIGGHIGAAFVSANAIVSQIVRMSTVFNQGISQASSTITGNTLGAGDRARTFLQGKILLRLSLMAGILASVIILIVSPAIIGQYNIAQDTIDVAYQLMRAVAVMVIFQALQSVTTKGILRGGGDTMFLMVADVVFLWCVSIPLGYVAGLVLHLPAFWVYIALKIDYLLKSLLCIYRFYTKKWMRRVTAPSKMEA